MTHKVGDKLTLKVAPCIQESYRVSEIIKATVTEVDPGDDDQPYRLLFDGQLTPSWVLADYYEVVTDPLSEPAATDDLDIAQVLFDFRDNEITLRYAVDKLKGLGV